jgi:lipoprotein-anchoring transpeptidase ErfK/SrfK
MTQLTSLEKIAASAGRCIPPLFLLLALVGPIEALGTGMAAGTEVTAEAIEEASLSELATPASGPSEPNAAVVKLQVLLDRAGASPGVIDGVLGENVEKAIAALEEMAGLPVDGRIDSDLLEHLPDGPPITRRYTIVAEDAEGVVGDVPDDFSQMAEMEFLGFETVAEKLAERFHMDEDLLAVLNPAATYAAGEELVVVDPGLPAAGEVSHIVADKTVRQVKAFAADGRLLAAYPATIGSTEEPSPAGTHLVAAIAPMPDYTYDPEVFQQGDNTEVLKIPPGPNGPVGSVWIDLTEPRFGIHGTPEPSQIDKTQSHGCIRLTNWDAEELAEMVSEGVPVEFVG